MEKGRGLSGCCRKLAAFALKSRRRSKESFDEREWTECRVRKATLVIAKLDRLARDAHFLLGLQRSGIAFTAAAMPICKPAHGRHYGDGRRGGATGDLRTN